MSRNPAIPQRTLVATLGDVVPLGTIEIENAGVPVNVSTRTYAAQIRPQAGATAVIDITIDTTDAATGKLELAVDLTDTDATPGTWWWDLVETDGTRVETILGGPFLIGARITEVV